MYTLALDFIYNNDRQALNADLKTKKRISDYEARKRGPTKQALKQLENVSEDRKQIYSFML
jgi:hypothetical protein